MNIKTCVNHPGATDHDTAHCPWNQVTVEQCYEHAMKAMEGENDRLRAERDALQERLNTVDQLVDTWETRACFEATKLHEAEAKLAERDALLLEVIGDVHFVIASDTRQRIEAALSASAEPKCQDGGMCGDSSHNCTGCAPVERDLDDDPFFVQQAEPHKPAPNPERDELADFEAYALDRGWLPQHLAEKTASGNYKDWAVNPEWQAWKARAALDKSTEGASHA